MRTAWYLRTSAFGAVLAVFAACSPPVQTTDGGTDVSTMIDSSDTTTPPRDVQSEGAATCLTDNDCDDHRFCNGHEACMPGAPGADAHGCIPPSSTPCTTSQVCDENQQRCTTTCADADGDGHTASSCGGDDCDDNDAMRFPGRTEVCDSTNHDEDCDTNTFGFRDNDGDGFASTTCCNLMPGADGGTTPFCGTDCNDNNPNVHPGQAEACNNIDDNCNDQIDDNVTSQNFYPDCDGDGFGDPAGTPVMSCSAPSTAPTCTSPATGATWVANSTDCDDHNTIRHPGAPEVCDPGTDVDEDCDPSTFGSRDNDGDTFISALCCNGTGGSRVCGPDCNDNAANTHPGATEVCGGGDENCNGTVDEPPAAASCVGTNTTFACTAGSCTIASCSTGFASCDGAPANGCETNLQTSHDHCGMCGRSCSTEQECIAGTCAISPFAEIAVGGNGMGAHVCARRGSGEVLCWGANNLGQLGDGTTLPRRTMDVPVSLSITAVQIVAGGSHACALGSDHTVWCWGADGYGQLGDGAIATSHASPVRVNNLNDAVAIAAGNYHTCAVRMNGSLVCWGSNFFGSLGDGTMTHRSSPVPVPGAGTVANVTAGTDFTCALHTDRTVVCWGAGGNGITGDGSTAQRSTPMANVTGLNDAVQIAAGGSHVCALRATGAVQCWGTNGSGELGTSNATPSTVPAAVVTGFTAAVAQISASESGTCARQTDGKVYCWGANTWGQVGDGTTTTRLRPTNPAIGVLDASWVSSRGTSACALGVTGQVMCWGSNMSGNLGDGTVTNRSTPVVVLNVNYAYQVSTGLFDTCALTGNHAVWCWGDNGYGMISRRSAASGAVQTPTALLDLGAITGDTISVGTSHACVINSSSAQCWYNNSYGQLGDGSTADSGSSPVNASLPSNAAEVIAGGNEDGAYSCARLTTGAVYCWGVNDVGQIGDGSITTRLTPVAVTGLTTVTQIALGQSHACALRANGSVVCWGANAFGQVGDGTTTGRRTFVQVSGLTSGVVEIRAGGYHTCARLATGAIRCWGRNANGQLGDGTTTNRLVPTAIAAFPTGTAAVAELSGGATHTCSRHVGGAVLCWGNNASGQVGDNTTTQRLVPTAITGVSRVVEIDSGGDHTCARDGAGQIFCWGQNGSGQLGDGSLTNRLVPTTARLP